MLTESISISEMTGRIKKKINDDRQEAKFMNERRGRERRRRKKKS